MDYAAHKDWSSAEKQSARKAIVNTYRKVTGNLHIPKGRQYWTLGGKMFGADGRTLPGCEFDQIVQKEGLARASQFNSVELVPAPCVEGMCANPKCKVCRRHLAHLAIHKGNERALPDATLHKGDISAVLRSALARRQLKPEVVNVDTMHELRKAVELLGRVMDPINYTYGPTLLVWSFVLVYRKYNYSASWRDVAAALSGDPIVQAQAGHGWSQIAGKHGKIVHFYGEKTPTVMGVVMFLRQGAPVCAPLG